jgi:hypothetical protein
MKLGVASHTMYLNLTLPHSAFQGEEHNESSPVALPNEKNSSSSSPRSSIVGQQREQVFKELTIENLQSHQDKQSPFMVMNLLSR